MAGIGIGIGLGLSGGRRANKPPNPDDIIRRFQSRDESILKDKFERDAQGYFPVSSFDSTGFVCDSATRIIEVGHKISVKYNTSIGGLQFLLGGNFQSVAIIIDSQQIRLYYNSSDSIIFSGAIPNSGELTIHRINDTDYEAFINSVSIGVNSTPVGANIRYDCIAVRDSASSAGRFNGYIFDLKDFDSEDNLYFAIPLPHLAVGYDPSLPQGAQEIPLTVTGGVSEAFDENGYRGLVDYGYSEKNGDIYPNNTLKQPIISDYTRLVNGTTFLNDSGALIRLFTLGDTDAEYTFFDKSNALIWKQTVRDSIYYDASNTGDWHTSELTQQYIYDNIQDAYKYQLWSKVNSLGIFKDIFLYPVSLGIEDAVKAGKYVGNPVVIPYEVTEGNYQVTEGDYLVIP